MSSPKSTGFQSKILLWILLDGVSVLNRQRYDLSYTPVENVLYYKVNAFQSTDVIFLKISYLKDFVVLPHINTNLATGIIP